MSTRIDDLEGFLTEWTAAERSGDAAALDKLLADDFAGVGPLGFTLSKQDWLDRHAAGDLKYRTFELADIAVRRYGDASSVDPAMDFGIGLVSPRCAAVGGCAFSTRGGPAMCER